MPWHHRSRSVDSTAHAETSRTAALRTAIASALGSSYAFRTAELLPVSEIVRQTWITDLAECRALAT